MSKTIFNRLMAGLVETRKAINYASDLHAENTINVRDRRCRIGKVSSKLGALTFRSFAPNSMRTP